MSTPELLAHHDRPGPRYTSYLTAVDFTGDFGGVATMHGRRFVRRLAQVFYAHTDRRDPDRTMFSRAA